MPPRHLRVSAAFGAVILFLGAWFATIGQERDDARAAASGPGTTSVARAGTAGTGGQPGATGGNGDTTTSTAPREAAVEPPPRPASDTQLAGLRFTDVTTSAGLVVTDPAPAFGTDSHNGGVGVGDLDGDGDLDVVLTGLGRAPNLFVNDGHGTFRDATERSGLADAGGFFGNAAVLLFDADGDGDLDVLLTGAGDAVDRLYRNDGGLRFTDVTAISGVATGPSGHDEPSNGAFGAAAADWNGDGHLDLMIVQWYTAATLAQRQFDQHVDPCGNPPAEPVPGQPASRTRLLRNDGNGHFTDVTAASGVPVAGIIGFQPVFSDVDHDGRPDLFVTGDYCTSRVFRNLGDDRFEDVTARLGVGTDENGMGSVVSDVDGDGILDWFVTGISFPTADGGCRNGAVPVFCSGNRLYLGTADGRFTDATDRFGVRDSSWGWGAVAADLNNQGRRSLVAVAGYDIAGDRRGDGFVDGIRERSSHPPNRVWLGADTTPWPEVAAQVGVTDRGDSKAVVAFDATGTGRLDLLITSTDGQPVLYRNRTPDDDQHRWLVLRLRQPGPNPYAVGATVTVVLPDGRRIVDEVRAGGSFQSTDPTDLHVGVGAVATIPRVEIRWPGQAEPTVLTDVATSRYLDVTPDA
jgi:hypothetical protein